ncbi:MAG: four helix bundle protein [Nitrosopumilus sp.]
MKGSFKELKVYQKAYALAIKIHHISKTFPKEETYSLTDQIRRASRSVCTNIAEGYRKRRYPKHFTSKMTDADGEASETTVWLDFAKEFKYIESEVHSALCSEYDEVGKMLGSMADNPEKFIPKNKTGE